jgi:RNase P subunit RPR2
MAVVQLTELAENRSGSRDASLRTTASRDLVRLGRRHNLTISPSIRPWICRGCAAPLRPGVSARVRVRSKVRLVTCLGCGRVSRRGPGYPARAGQGKRDGE